MSAPFYYDLGSDPGLGELLSKFPAMINFILLTLFSSSFGSCATKYSNPASDAAASMASRYDSSSPIAYRAGRRCCEEA